MSRRIISAAICSSISILLIATALVTADATLAQTPPATPTAQPTATPIPTPAPTPTTSCVTQPELISVYREVLESSQSAIENVRSTSKEMSETSQSAVENVQSTTKTVLWLVGAAYVVLTAEGLGSLWLAQRARRESEQAIQKAQDATQAIDQIEHSVSEIQDAREGLIEQVEEIRRQIGAASEEISELQTDVEWYRSLMLVAQIKKHGLKLFRESEREDAANSLREQLKHKDPIAQLEVVCAFQVWAELQSRDVPELRMRIEQILETLIDSKPEPLVDLEARRTLEALRSQRRKGSRRR